MYSKKNYDTTLDPWVYKCERERLMTILNDFEQLYINYKDLLLNSPDEVGFGKNLIKAALFILNSAPSDIKESRTIVPVLKNLKVPCLEIVQPPMVQVVTSRVVKKSSKVFIKKAPSVFVVPVLKILKVQCVEYTLPCVVKTVKCEIEKLLSIEIKRKPRVCVDVC